MARGAQEQELVEQFAGEYRRAQTPLTVADGIVRRELICAMPGRAD